MTTRLNPEQAARHIQQLRARGVLTALQAVRLDAILAILAEDGRFVLRDALAAAEFPPEDGRGQDAFQDFRKRINQAAAQAGIELALELDSRKTTPEHRHGWFTGGDLVTTDIAAFTEAAAAQPGITHAVDPTVTELDGSRRTRVYISFCPVADPHTRRRVTALLTQLRQHLALDADRAWDVNDTNSTALGHHTEQTRTQLSAMADVRIALITPSYLSDQSPEEVRAERDRVLGNTGPVVAFAFSALPDGPLPPGRLDRHDIHHLSDPWDQLGRTERRGAYVADLLAALRRALQPAQCPGTDPTAASSDAVLIHWTTTTAARRRPEDSTHAVPSELAETALRGSSLGDPGRRAGTALPAVPRLVHWVTDNTTNSAPLCALLGDVGMGKTTTVRLFAQRLLDLHVQDPRCPLPILFDLRDVRVSDLTAGMTTDRILGTMLDAGRPSGITAEQLSAAVVRARIDQGNTVVIFDGLDEVLVHLSPNDQHLFTRQLWRTVGPASGSKLLVTCRTQYFRTVREETTYFLGEDRQGLRGDNYLALLMLPFRDDQVREYLMANLGQDSSWVDDFLDTIAGVHNLTDLSHRPMTLRLIADQVEFIETTKARGGTLTAVDLYQEFVQRWLSRDTGKHTLLPDHKQLLMEHLAAALWTSGRSAWEQREMEHWLLALLKQRPDLQLHYRQWLPDLWTADFRTATFLSRDGDTFSFSHRSLFEYFLASYLCHTLLDTQPQPDQPLHDQPLRTWAMPMPSVETLDFVGQLLAGLPHQQQATALAALRSTATTYTPQVTELALAYALHAARRAYPHQSLIDIDLTGAVLTDWTFGSSSEPVDTPGARSLRMTGARFGGANLRRATFHRVDLTGADFTGAELANAEMHHSQLASAVVDHAQLTGTILRHCVIDGLDLSSAVAYRAQLLHCTPQATPTPGWLIAPHPQPRPEPPDTTRQLHHLSCVTGGVSSVAYSPDGTHIAIGASASASARGGAGVSVWDAATGELLHRLAGVTGDVSSVAYSPDGTHIAAGIRTGHRAGGGGVWVWDAATGVLLHRLAGVTGDVSSVAYSPDGTHIAIGASARGGAGVWVWDAATGVLLHRLAGVTGDVSSVAYSPDGTHIAVGASARGGGGGGLGVWDAATGALLHHRVGVTGGVWSVAYSPDGTRIATGIGTGHRTGADDSGVSVWDAATGALLHHRVGVTGGVWSVAYSPDGTRIAAGGGDGGVWMWVAATGASLHLPTVTGGVWSVAYSPDGTRIAAGTDTDYGTGEVWVWDTATAELLHHLTGVTGDVWSVVYSPDGTHIAASTGVGDGAGDGGVWVWGAATGELLHRLSGVTGRVWSLVYSPDGTRIAARTGVGDGAHAGDGEGVWMWDAATGELLHHLAGVTGDVSSVVYSPDGTHIAAGIRTGHHRAGGGGVWVWDAATGVLLHRLAGVTGDVSSVAYSPDGTHIAAGTGAGAGDGGGVWVWDAATGELLHRLSGVIDRVWSLVYSPDGTGIAAAGDGGGVWVWDAATGVLLHRLAGVTGDVSSVVYSPDGTYIAAGTGTSNGGLGVWDAATGVLLHRLAGVTGDVSSVVYSPDGTHIAAITRTGLGAGDGGVWVWDTHTARPTMTVRYLSSTEFVVMDAVRHEIINASSDAWRSLRWKVIKNGRLAVLPVETFGALPHRVSTIAGDCRRTDQSAQSFTGKRAQMVIRW